MNLTGRVWRLLLVTACCLAAGGLAAAAAQERPLAGAAPLSLPAYAPASSPLTCPKLTSALVIDGLDNDWAGAGAIVLNAAVAEAVTGAPDSPADLSATLRCAWDTQALHLFAYITDDVLIADSSVIWDDDSLEIALDGARDRACCSSDDLQLTFAVDGRLANFGALAGALPVRRAVRPRVDGYSIEASIPFTMFLAPPPVTGLQIGFNWGLDDDDDGGRRDAHLLWAGSAILNYPRFGDVLLGAAVTPGATATPTTPAGPTATRTATPPVATATATPPVAPATATATPPVAPATATPSPVPPTATPTAVATPTALADRLTALEKDLGILSSNMWEIWRVMQAAGYLPGDPPARGTVTPTATPTALAQGVRLLVRSGGETYVDKQGRVWQADQPYTLGSWGYVGGSAYTTANAISGAADPALYQAERFNMTAYRFDLPPGRYQVELHFAEIYQYAAANQRVFDVVLEGNTVLSNLDLFAVAGHYVAFVRSFDVEVQDGQLNMDFISRKGAGKISAIRITGLGPSGPPPTPSLLQRLDNLERQMTEMERLFEEVLTVFSRFLGLR